MFDVDPSGAKVLHVACGARHTLALCKGGELFSWGDNTYGQLGYQTEQKLCHTPTRINVLSGTPLAQVLIILNY